MKIEKLIANNQPSNWFEEITNECKSYPIHLVDIQKDELVMDIGANVGGFWNAWKFRFDNWHLVEPSIYNCEQIVSNGYEGVYSHNAVGSESGETLKLMKYWGDEDNDTLSGNFGTTEFVWLNNGHGWYGDYEEVTTISFDAIRNKRDIGLLKVDCEGAEYDFLMNKDLKNVKYIVMELHNFLGADKQNEFMQWIENTHTEIYSEGDGIESHYVKLWKRK